MSQEKVDRYKQEKAKRKQTLKREKIKKNILSVVGTIACIAIVGWIGYSGYGYFQAQKAANPTQTEVDLNALNDYLEGLSDAENTQETAE